MTKSHLRIAVFLTTCRWARRSKPCRLACSGAEVGRRGTAAIAIAAREPILGTDHAQATARWTKLLSLNGRTSFPHLCYSLTHFRVASHQPRRMKMTSSKVFWLSAFATCLWPLIVDAQDGLDTPARRVE